MSHLSIFDLIAILLAVVALLSYINDRFFRLPSAIGLMGISLLISLGLLGLGTLGYDVQQPARRFIMQADFGETLMKGLLSLLLFAGAIQFRLKDLAQEKYTIALLATVGVACSTFITGSILYGLATLFHFELPYIYCLIFGALISPTDPVAVLAVLKNSKISKSLETKIVGESLFNDGVAVVLFVVLLEIATGKTRTLNADAIAMLLMRQIVGGIIFGWLVGGIAHRFLRGVREHAVEVLITSAVAYGSYTLATRLHLSAPISVVVAAIVIGNQRRKEQGRKASTLRLEEFWELIDELLNAMLFVWIGLAVLAFSFSFEELRVGLYAVPVVLLGRLLSIWIAATVFGLGREFTPSTYSMMTWGGIRGGVSVALVLALPPNPAQDILISMTYVVVVFSILVQGPTVGRLFKGR